MSILIRDMEMPDSCFHCKLADVCQHYKAEHYANKRHEDCPLEEVPETHEKRTETHACDCISRQAAIDALNVGAELLRRVLDDADIVGAERAKYEWGLGLIESYISDMKEIPSAQPEPYKGERNEHREVIFRKDMPNLR